MEEVESTDLRHSHPYALYKYLCLHLENFHEATLDVPGLLVKPGLLGKGNSSSVVTEEFDWPRRIGYES